jgi:hypothetical protein
MNRDQKFFHRLLDRAIALADAPGDGQEMTWAECLAIVHEAGDRAARLGLAQIVTKARRFRRIATPGEAQALIAECLAALTPAPAAADEMLSLPEAAKLLGYTQKGLRNIVDRSKRALAGRRVDAPTIEFAQAGVRGAIRFRREWLDAFIAGHPPAPATKTKGAAVRAKSSHGLSYDLLGR